MLDNILSMVKPEEFVFAMKRNPVVVQIVLQKLDAYRSFGEALREDQQVFLSNNLNKLDAFFSSQEGKEAINVFVNRFLKFGKS